MKKSTIKNIFSVVVTISVVALMVYVSYIVGEKFVHEAVNEWVLFGWCGSCYILIPLRDNDDEHFIVRVLTWGTFILLSICFASLGIIGKWWCWIFILPFPILPVIFSGVFKSLYEKFIEHPIERGRPHASKDETEEERYLKDRLFEAPHRQKPAYALHLAQLYSNQERYALAHKYASLTVEMIDSVEPSDLIGPYQWIASQLSRMSIYRDACGILWNDPEYEMFIEKYRLEMSRIELYMSKKASAARKAWVNQNTYITY